MIRRGSIAIPNVQHTQEGIAEYFGVGVEVLVRIRHCSLIRYGGREFVVATEDLQDSRAVQLVA